MSEDKTPLALIAELEDMVYGDASALSMLFGQLRDKLQPETFLVDQEILDLINRCDDDFVIEYEVLAERCGHTRCARCYGKWEPRPRKARAVEFSSADIGANRITRATLDAIKAHVAEREQWVDLADEHYAKLDACGDGFDVESQYHSKLSEEWADETRNKSAIVLGESTNYGRSRVLRTEWAKVEKHLAEMVELPDDLIPPNTQIVGGVDVLAKGNPWKILFRDASKNWPYNTACPNNSYFYNIDNITISRLNLHRLKTGEIEMRAIKFEEAK